MWVTKTLCFLFAVTRCLSVFGSVYNFVSILVFWFLCPYVFDISPPIKCLIGSLLLVVSVILCLSQTQITLMIWLEELQCTSHDLSREERLQKITLLKYKKMPRKISKEDIGKVPINVGEITRKIFRIWQWWWNLENLHICKSNEKKQIH